MSKVLRRPVLRYGSYVHSVVYSVLLWAAITDREAIVSVLGWVHGVGWIVMSLLCLTAVRRRVIPSWLGVMVAVVLVPVAPVRGRGRDGDGQRCQREAEDARPSARMPDLHALAPLRR